MKKMIIVLIVLCMMLSGCSFWLKGSYSSVTPHTEPSKQVEKPVVNVSNDKQMKEALIALVNSGAESGVFYMQYTLEELARSDVEAVVHDVQKNDPFAAYAVKGIHYEIGTVNGMNAVSLHITYLQNRIDQGKIRQVSSLEMIKAILLEQLEACETGVVFLYDNSESVDFAQLVADLAMEYPQRVMEAPEVTAGRYPETGKEQIIDVKFSYQTSREELRTLQNRVAPVFQSAAQYVSGNWTAEAKAERLYTFLMDRYEYNIQTSITPAYSLLLHGVGDQRAFAMVYAAMCRQSGVECRVVIGTRGGAPWTWNAINIGGVYYYVDLLRWKENGTFRLSAQEEMKDYVWDYSAYPIAAGENS